MTNIDTQVSATETLLNSIVTATTDVLGTMANSTVNYTGTIGLEAFIPNHDISGIIGIAGDAGEGMIALSLTSELADMMVARLVGLQPDQISKDDRADGVGELINMISGQCKAKLSSASGTLYKLSLPTIIQGKNHQIANNCAGTQTSVLHFKTEGQGFTMQVSFKAV